MTAYALVLDRIWELANELPAAMNEQVAPASVMPSSRICPFLASR